MSTKALEDFGKKIDSSKDAQKESDNLYNKLGAATADAHNTYFNSMVELGKKHGFEFTAEEVCTQFQKAANQLSDDQLDNVAGGTLSRMTASQTTATPGIQPAGAIAPVDLRQVSGPFEPRLPGRGSVAGT